MKQSNQIGPSEKSFNGILSILKWSLAYLAVVIVCTAIPIAAVVHYKTNQLSDRFHYLITGYPSVSTEHRFPGKSDGQTAFFCDLIKEWTTEYHLGNYKDFKTCYDSFKNDFGRFDDPESDIDLSVWDKNRFLSVNDFLFPRYEIIFQNPPQQSNKNPQKIYRDPL